MQWQGRPTPVGPGRSSQYPPCPLDSSITDGRRRGSQEWCRRKGIVPDACKDKGDNTGFKKNRHMPGGGDEPDVEEMEAREHAEGKGNRVRHERVEREREQAGYRSPFASSSSGHNDPDLIWGWPAHGNMTVTSWFHNDRYVPYDPRITDGRLRHSRLGFPQGALR